MTAGPAFGIGLAAGAAAAAGLGLCLARRRERRLGSFLSHAAHEINTPVTALNITILNLLGGVFGEVPADHVQWIDMMREQIGRLHGMVAELRDLVELMSGRKLRLNPENASPAELVEGALAAIRRGFVQANLEATAAVPADLPRVRVDRDRTIRTLTSLFFHARKFRSGGGLRVSAERSGGAVALIIEYQALPQPPGEPERSLELLYPARARADRSLNAVGLGLGVLRAVARSQGGDLGFQVGPDGRAALTLTLPLSPDPARGTAP